MKLLKLFAGAALLTIAASSVFAAVPNLMNFQGVLKDGSGNPVANGSYTVTFNMYPTPTGGALLWTESQSVTTTAGLFAVVLGSTNPVPDSVFKDTTRYLGVAVSPDPEMLPRQRLVTVGYSFRVNSVDGASGGAITSKVSIGPGHTNSGVHAFVAGEGNQVTGGWAAVGGGRLNIASAHATTVGGGDGNSATVHQATIGGGGQNVASASNATVGGGLRGMALAGASTVAGGMDNRANGDFSAVGGGGLNAATAYGSTVGGGVLDTASADNATVSGGRQNVARGMFSTVAGGDRNVASNINATVSGGGLNTASGDGATIGGGSSNLSVGMFSTIAGGLDHASMEYVSTVGGGYLNAATDTGATVGGGWSNHALANFSLVGGGAYNIAAGRAATVSGGIQNSAPGEAATISGGWFNVALGNLSHAAGYRAKANHLGAYVWADTSLDVDFSSTGSNQYLIRAAGGVGINTNTPSAGLQVLGGVAIGAGTPIQTVLSGTGSLDFPSTAAATVSELGITVTGAISGDVVSLGVPVGSVPAGGSFFAWVSGANTVTVRFSNATAGALNPSSGTFRAMVTKF